MAGISCCGMNFFTPWPVVSSPLQLPGIWKMKNGKDERMDFKCVFRHFRKKLLAVSLPRAPAWPFLPPWLHTWSLLLPEQPGNRGTAEVYQENLGKWVANGYEIGMHRNARKLFSTQKFTRIWAPFQWSPKSSAHPSGTSFLLSLGTLSLGNVAHRFHRDAEKKEFLGLSVLFQAASISPTYLCVNQTPVLTCVANKLRLLFDQRLLLVALLHKHLLCLSGSSLQVIWVMHVGLQVSRELANVLIFACQKLKHHQFTDSNILLWTALATGHRHPWHPCSWESLQAGFQLLEFLGQFVVFGGRKLQLLWEFLFLEQTSSQKFQTWHQVWNLQSHFAIDAAWNQDWPWSKSYQDAFSATTSNWPQWQNTWEITSIGSAMNHVSILQIKFCVLAEELIRSRSCLFSASNFVMPCSRSSLDDMLMSGLRSHTCKITLLR